MKTGDCVKVKKGVLDSDFEKYDITGWQGRIIVIYDIDDIQFDIELDSITLKQIPKEYIWDSLHDGSDYAIIEVLSSDVEKTEPRDTIKEVQAVRQEMNKKLDYVSVLDEEEDITNLPERCNFVLGIRNLRINDDVKNLNYKEVTKIVRLKILKALLEVRDKRRSIDKNYYRHNDKYIKIDNEMKEELKDLLEKNKK